MKKQYTIIIILIVFLSLSAQALFEVKDSSDNTVLEVATDGLRIFNMGDTLMVISSSEITFIIDQNTKDRALSRSFSVTTSTSAEKGGLRNVFEIGNDSTTIGTSSTTMREGVNGDHYTDFSPENIFLGLKAGESTSGVNNVFLGNSSGYSNLFGGNNVYIGTESGYFSENTYQNTYVGYRSGYNMTGASNTIMGSSAGADAGGTTNNTFVGSSSGMYASGGNNTFFGNSSGYAMSVANTGTRNTYIGQSAGSSTTSGSYNVLMGFNAGEYNRSGSYNTIIGYLAGEGSYDVSYSGNVFLGSFAGTNETASDRLYIANSNTPTPLIYGEFDNDLVTINGELNVTGNSTINGNVGIGTPVSTSYGLNVLHDYYGVRSFVSTTTGAYTYGVYGDVNGGTTRNVSIYGGSPAGTGTNWAGYFNGDINVVGTVVKSADQIKIDHPLDPENKFLTHSSVESDKMMNIYNGNAILDSEGKAFVRLPDWFEAFNKDVRYQLTAIGAPGPNLYIAKEINNMTFEIVGGTPNMKVSWLITGSRNDKFAKSNPLEVEITKDLIEKGYYLHPEAYGFSKKDGIEYQHEKKMEDR